MSRRIELRRSLEAATSLSILKAFIRSHPSWQSHFEMSQSELLYDAAPYDLSNVQGDTQPELVHESRLATAASILSSIQPDVNPGLY